MKPIQPIQTVYKGYKFRSRLEARWAVYFDAQGIEWEYEKEGFDLGKDGRYLPDFWLPQVNMWAEVKPRVYEGYLEKGDDYAKQLSKVSRFVKAVRQPCVLLYGSPEAKPYEAVLVPPDGKGVTTETYCLTNYHGYIFDEHRFYGSPGDGDRLAFDEGVDDAVRQARQARFEYGETP